MLSHRITIENRDYTLEDGVDVDALQLEICDAMRKGGGIVSFDVVHERRMTAIVSPGVPVFFERIRTPDAGEFAIPAESADPSVADYLEGY